MQKRLKLIQMNIVFLTVDMPQHRPGRPLGPDKGILAAHRVEVTAPEQAIVVILRDKRQHLQGQRATHLYHSRRHLLQVQPAQYIRKYPPLRHQ